MKLIVALCVSLVFLVAGCKPNPAELILKRWRPVDATGKSVTDESKEILLKPGNGMEFLPDGKFITYSLSDGNDTGRYKFGAEMETVNVYSSKNEETIFTIEELKSNRLILENEGIILVLRRGK